MRKSEALLGILVVLVMFCSATVLYAAPLLVQAEGVGKPPTTGTPAQKLLMARRAAEVVALRELTKKVRGAAVSPDGKTEWVSGLVRGHQFSPPQQLPDGSVRVIAQITLDQLGGNYRTLWLQVHNQNATVVRLQNQVGVLTAEKMQQQAALQQQRAENQQLRAQMAALQNDVAKQLASLQAQFNQLMTIVAQQQAEINRLKQKAGEVDTPPIQPPQ